MHQNNQQPKDLEKELIEECTCNGPWGRQGCPVHRKHTEDKPKNDGYDSWQIEMMHWGVHD